MTAVVQVQLPAMCGTLYPSHYLMGIVGSDDQTEEI